METTLGTRIAAHRKKLGMTQDKLAEKLGVTAQAVSKWENDQSCPDVTMLPKLAEIFGTTTDALLGIETVHEAEVVTPEADHTIHLESDKDGGLNINIGGNGRRGSIVFALWILAFGGLLLGSSFMDMGPGWWALCWTSFLLVYGIAELLKKFSFFGLGMSLVGGYFLVSAFRPVPLNKELVLPGLILLFGASLLVDAVRKPKTRRFAVTHNASGEKVEKHAFQCSGETFACSTSFGEATRDIDLPRLSGGSADVSFGELTVDLTDVEEFAPDCQLVLNCSFGELDLLVPRRCRVEYTDSHSFGSVEISGRPQDDAADRILVDCSASFGEIEIRYI